MELPRNIGVVSLLFLQGIFLTQGLKSHLLHWQVGSISLSHQGSPHSSIIFPDVEIFFPDDPGMTMSVFYRRLKSFKSTREKSHREVPPVPSPLTSTLSAEFTPALCG